MNETILNEKTNNKIIVFIDAVCPICNKFAVFIYKKSNKKIFIFSSLQSTNSKFYIGDFSNQLDTIVVSFNGIIYTELEAIIIIFKHLRPPWSFVYFLKYLPAFLKKLIYKFISKNRYIIQNKKNTCDVINKIPKDSII